MKKNRKNKFIKWIIIIAALAIVGILAYPWISGLIQGNGVQTQSQAMLDTTGNVGSIGSYGVVSKGHIQKTVYGSGNLTSAQTSTVYSGAPGTVESVGVTVGDSVKAGDVIMSLASDDLETEIATLQSELFAQQLALQDVRDSGTTSSVYAPATGRIKMMQAKEEDDVSMIMQLHGYLCVVSRDGKMRVEFEPAIKDMKVGDHVTVWIDGAGVAGIVDQVTGLQGKIAVTIEDDTYDVGKEVSITTPESDKLGTGVLQINMPIPVTAVGGTVDTIYYEDNDKITSGSRIFYLDGKTPSAELTQTYLAYDEARISLEKAQKKQDSLIVRAPIDGVITAVNTSLGAKLEESTAAFAIQSNTEFKLVATVDELDIVGVEAGQTAIVEFDAFPDKKFRATVQRISGLGTVSGGVATYEVTLVLQDTEGLMDGMTASADVVVADKSDVLLVPVEAISTANGQNYVTLASGSTSNVTIGVSDDTNVEILSGLNEGDSVRIVKSSSETSGSAVSQFGGMGMGGNVMIPAGGAMGGGTGRTQ